MKRTIAIFTLNTASLCITETLVPEIKEEHRTSKLSTWYDGVYPDFFVHVMSILKKYEPDVIVFGNQEDRSPGSYFHSHFLVTYMPRHGYKLLKTSSLMGVGVTSYKNLFNGDIMTRGLSTSIYVRKEIYSEMIEGEIEIRNETGGDGQLYYLQDKITRGKGATSSYIKFPDTEKIAIINCHLPFHAKSLINTVIYNEPMMRQTQISNCNSCFNSIVEELVVNQGYTPRHVIFFGDMNYRINLRARASVVASYLSNNPRLGFIQELIKRDELRSQIGKGNIYRFTEGIDDMGPLFLPTSKLIKGRRVIKTVVHHDKFPMENDEGHSIYDILDIPFKPDVSKSRKERGDTYWNTGRYDQRVPSWCDRILYKDMKDYMGNGNSEYDRETKCIYYNRFECGTCINLSDHCGVVGVFTI
jgi:hypothetical protein